MSPDYKAIKNESKKYSHFFLKIFKNSIAVIKKFRRFALPIQRETIKSSLKY